MLRPSLSFSTFAPVLAAIFALAAIVLVMTSRSQLPPRFSDLTVIEGALRGQSTGFGGTKLRLATKAGEQTVGAGACSSFIDGLQPGDAVAVWVDKSSRAWRVMRGTKPMCTVMQATVADETSRHTRRVAAVVLALIGVACVGATMIGRRRVRLIDEGSTA